MITLSISNRKVKISPTKVCKTVSCHAQRLIIDVEQSYKDMYMLSIKWHAKVEVLDVEAHEFCA